MGEAWVCHDQPTELKRNRVAVTDHYARYYGDCVTVIGSGDRGRKPHQKLPLSATFLAPRNGAEIATSSTDKSPHRGRRKCRDEHIGTAAAILYMRPADAFLTIHRGRPLAPRTWGSWALLERIRDPRGTRSAHVRVVASDDLSGRSARSPTRIVSVCKPQVAGSIPRGG